MKEKPFMLLPLLIISTMEHSPPSEAYKFSSTQPIFILMQPELLFLCPNLFTNKFDINLLKPTGYLMQQQFNIQQLYAVPTLYLCVLYLSENKQRLVPLTA